MHAHKSADHHIVKLTTNMRARLKKVAPLHLKRTGGSGPMLALSAPENNAYATENIAVDEAPRNEKIVNIAGETRTVLLQLSATLLTGGVTAAQKSRQ